MCDIPAGVEGRMEMSGPRRVSSPDSPGIPLRSPIGCRSRPTPLSSAVRTCGASRSSSTSEIHIKLESAVWCSIQSFVTGMDEAKTIPRGIRVKDAIDAFYPVKNLLPALEPEQCSAFRELFCFGLSRYVLLDGRRVVVV